MVPRAVSGVFTGLYSEDAVIKLAQDLRRQMGGSAALGFVFLTQEWRPFLEDTLELIRLHAHVSQLVGCSGWGLVGQRQEIEDSPGFSILLLAVPPNSFQVFTFTEQDLAEALVDANWNVVTKLSATQVKSWLVFVHPQLDGIETWLEQWNEAYPSVPTVGGLSSARGSEFFLLRDGTAFHGGLIALAFTAAIVVRPLVSQGCRPIGEPLPITKVEENLILAIGNLSAYQTLESAFLSIPVEERGTVRDNLFLGLATSEYVEHFRRGDFLIRNILGADPRLGALAVGAFPRVGQTIQFQLRDANSAHLDLVETCQKQAPSLKGSVGILLFSCTGRGKGLFGVANHDAATIAECLGDLPLAGFFCNGEIGPVGQENFLHGYTASAAVLCAD